MRRWLPNLHFTGASLPTDEVCNVYESTFPPREVEYNQTSLFPCCSCILSGLKVSLVRTNVQKQDSTIDDSGEGRIPYFLSYHDNFLRLEIILTQKVTNKPKIEPYMEYTIARHLQSFLWWLEFK